MRKIISLNGVGEVEIIRGVCTPLLDRQNKLLIEVCDQLIAACKEEEAAAVLVIGTGIGTIPLYILGARDKLGVQSVYFYEEDITLRRVCNAVLAGGDYSSEEDYEYINRGNLNDGFDVVIDLSGNEDCLSGKFKTLITMRNGEVTVSKKGTHITEEELRNITRNGSNFEMVVYSLVSLKKPLTAGVIYSALNRAFESNENRDRLESDGEELDTLIVMYELANLINGLLPEKASTLSRSTSRYLPVTKTLLEAYNRLMNFAVCEMREEDSGYFSDYLYGAVLGGAYISLRLVNGSLKLRIENEDVTNGAVYDSLNYWRCDETANGRRRGYENNPDHLCRD